MFFKKKAAPVEKKLELIYQENVKTGCPTDTQENIIRALGDMLAKTGYVNPAYADGMLEREKTYSTFMGNGLALPHGVEAAKKEVKASGIAVMTFPEGVLWGEETAHIVVAVAGVGDDHLEILSLIAEKIMDEESLEKLMHGDDATVFQVLSGKA